MTARLLRWAIYVAIAIGFALACAYLSQWQFDRSESREDDLALIERNYDAEPVPLDDLLRPDGTFAAADEWRPVTLTGEYLADAEVYARNRPHAGQNTFEVLVPFQLDSGVIFLVNRGWVPTGEGEGPDAVASPPSGQVTVTARLRPSEAAPASGRGAPEQQVARIHLPTVIEVTGTAVAPGGYAQLIAETPAAQPALGGFEAPTDDPGPHLSYAIQWILFAIMGFVFIVYVIRTEIQKQKDEAQGIEPVPRRRKDRDADTEDALLDALER